MYETRARKSSFIHEFIKTPEGIMCPHFFILAFANGCPFKCHYCYLQGTFRFNKMPVLYNNFDKLIENVQTFLARKEPSVLNAGELTDSLVWGLIGREMFKKIIPMFDGTKHILLLLTKNTNIEMFQTMFPSNNVIVSFSLNSEYMSYTYEKGAPCSTKRTLAIKKLLSMKWRVRARIDPMIAHRGWQKEYSNLIQGIDPRVERVTLGTLRYFPGLRGKLKDMARAEKCLLDGRYRLLFRTRLKLYEFAIRKLKEHGIKEIGVCKEEKLLWEMLEIPYGFCNCTV